MMLVFLPHLRVGTLPGSFGCWNCFFVVLLICVFDLGQGDIDLPNVNQCDKFKDCVRCKVHKTGPITENECSLVSSCPWSLEVSESLKVNTERGEVHCVFTDDDQCKYEFSYFIDGKEGVELTAQVTKNCPVPVNLTTLLIGGTACLLLIVLLVLLTKKAYTIFQDYKERTNFERYSRTASWDTGENPFCR